MNKSELPRTKEVLEINDLRTRVQEIVDSREGEDSYAERLKESFDELLFSISQTIGKVEGGDNTSEGLSESSLKDLQAKLDTLKTLLP